MRDFGPNPDATRAFYATVGKRQNNWGSHGVPRVSSIGKDLRQQYFNLRRDVYPPAPISGESIWGMAEGNWQEPQVYEVLREMGYQVHSAQAGAVRYLPAGTNSIHDVQVKVVPTGEERMSAVVDALRRTEQTPLMTMHIDGIIEGGPDGIPPTLLELKKATMFSFGGMVQHGIRDDKREYWFQAQICAASFGLSTARFYVFTRDRSATEWYFTKMRSKNPITANPALYVEDVVVDDRFVKMGDARALYLVGALERGIPPDPDPGVWPLNVKIEKNGEQEHVYPCGWCEWREPCLQELRDRGVNINKYTVVEDHRSKKEKEAAAAEV
jgi:hypothetical protein